MNDMNTNLPPKRSRAAQIIFVVTAGLAALAATGLLAIGALALWGDSEKDSDGYLSTSSERFEASTHALSTENLDIDLDGVEGILNAEDMGDVRLAVESKTDQPLFVGIARTSDVSDYLDDVAHTTLTDLDSDPFRADYSSSAGERSPAPPAERDIWVASEQGNGTQTLDWNIDDGDWSVVVMNADGSAGVQADISAGAKVPFLDELGWSSIGGGALLLMGATVLLVLGLRPPRSGPGQPAVVAPAPAAA